jgi:hypothetical protein
MNSNDPTRQDSPKREPAASQSGQKPTTSDSEARMTSEDDAQTPDESQAGRMGEGRPGERGVRHEPPPQGDTDSDLDRPGADQNRHGDEGGTS